MLLLAYYLITCTILVRYTVYGNSSSSHLITMCSITYNLVCFLLLGFRGYSSGTVARRFWHNLIGACTITEQEGAFSLNCNLIICMLYLNRAISALYQTTPFCTMYTLA